MKRKEYLERLEQLLLVLPYEEREEALQYYTDYFDDAGVENEERVMRELGRPEEVAAKIRAGYAGEYAEYSEQGFADTRFHENKEIMVDPTGANSDWEDVVEEEVNEGGYRKEKKERKRNQNVWKMIAILLLALFGLPILLPLGAAGVATVIAILVAVVAVIMAFGVAGFSVFLAGIIIIVAGITKILFSPAAGILAIGVGGIVLAVGILLAWAIILIFAKVMPQVIRGIVNIVKRLFQKVNTKCK